MKRRLHNVGEQLVDNIALLVKHNHDEGEIFSYTLDKFCLYVEAVSRLDTRYRVEYITDTMYSIAQVLVGADDKSQDHFGLLKKACGGYYG